MKVDDIAAQLARYHERRAAMTLPDGTRPCAWWKRYQTHLSIPEVSQADIEKDAARLAKMQAEVTDE